MVKISWNNVQIRKIYVQLKTLQNSVKMAFSQSRLTSIKEVSLVIVILKGQQVILARNLGVSAHAKKTWLEGHAPDVKLDFMASLTVNVSWLYILDTGHNVNVSKTRRHPGRILKVQFTYCVQGVKYKL